MIQMISWPEREPDEKLLRAISLSDEPKLKNTQKSQKIGGPNPCSKLDRSLEVVTALVIGCSSEN